MLRRAAVGQTHRKAQTLADDRALEENIVAEIADLTRHNFVGKLFDPLVHLPFGMVGHTGYFAEDPVTDFLNTGLYASHSSFRPP